MVAPLPGWVDRFQLTCQGRGIFALLCQCERFQARRLKQFVIAEWLRERECGVAVLTGPEKFSRTALLQITLGYFKAIGRCYHRFDALEGLAGRRFGRDQDAVRLLVAASDPAPQLVQLR